MKPDIKDIKYYGTMMGKEVWVNEDGIKLLLWYQKELHEQMKKNVLLEEEKYARKPKVEIPGFGGTIEALNNLSIK